MRGRSRCRWQGFSLVEILVGLAIGMLGMLVMMQVFLSAEAHMRSTSGTGDAQTNGSSAVMSLQRELRQAGFGITVMTQAGCNLQLRSGVKLNVLAPLTINHAAIPAGDAGSDTLLIVSGSAGGSPHGDVIVMQPATNVYSVSTPTAFLPDDYIFVAPVIRPNPCDLILESVITITSTPPNLTVTIGVANSVNGTLVNLGQAPRLLAYAVRHSMLTVCDYLLADCANSALVNDETVWLPMYSGIVALRAQYGRDTTPVPMDGQLDVWDQITPGSPADVLGFSLKCSMARVLGARIGLLARNEQFEKTAVTTKLPVWAGSATAPFDVQQTDWDHYRYRVYQSVVPLRNVVMLGAQSGC
jgi:type IV pilus assembly protein PilW